MKQTDTKIVRQESSRTSKQSDNKVVRKEISPKRNQSYKKIVRKESSLQLTTPYGRKYFGKKLSEHEVVRKENSLHLNTISIYIFRSAVDAIRNMLNVKNTKISDFNMYSTMFYNQCHRNKLSVSTMEIRYRYLTCILVFLCRLLVCALHSKGNYQLQCLYDI